MPCSKVQLHLRADRDLAARLASRLEANGLSVAWDTTLLSGDDYRLAMARQIDEAGAVVALWTQNSAGSRFLYSEAREALRGHKLIPLKTRGFPLEALPPEFQVLQTIDIDDFDGLLRALSQMGGRATAAPPDQEPHIPAPARARPGASVSLSRARIAFWSYAGVIGAVFTIVGNLDAAYKLARLARLLFGHWIEVITWVWRKIIFFRIDVLPEDAVYFTTLSLLFVNLVITSVSRDTLISRRRAHYTNMVGMLVVICVLSCVGFATKASGAPGGLISLVIDYTGLRSMPAPWPTGSREHLLLVYGFLLAAGVGLMFLVFAPIALLWQLQANPQGFANRLMRIVVGVGVVIALNYSLLLVEDQPWIKELFG